MKLFTSLLAVVLSLAGIGFSATAFYTINSIVVGGVNPRPVANIYSEATFYAIMAVATFVFAGVVMLYQIVIAVENSI